MEFDKQLIITLDRYKRKSHKDPLILIPIYDEKDIIVAYLHPITADFEITMPQCISLLSKWRRENPTLSPARFKITDERTKNWLYNLVINNNDRILFMIEDLAGNDIGHIGFASFDTTIRMAEVDSVLKGNKESVNNIMKNAMDTLIAWGKNVLELKAITLEVLSDNNRAIAFYKKCGFVEERIIPLEMEEIDDEIKWHPIEGNSSNSGEKAFLLMRLKNEGEER